MNQQILFNDDFCYEPDARRWYFTGFLNGQRIVIYSQHDGASVSNEEKLDIEAEVEDYLENNEPNDDGEIWL